MNASLLFAASSVPAPAGRTSPWAVAVILILLAVGFALALRAALAHFRGQGGCCGGGGACVPPTPHVKPLGPVVFRRALTLDGLHCMNCVNRVARALNAIPGVAADVTLDPQRALVCADREVPDDVLRKAVEDEGFRVVAAS